MDFMQMLMQALQGGGQTPGWNQQPQPTGPFQQGGGYSGWPTSPGGPMQQQIPPGAWGSQTAQTPGYSGSQTAPAGGGRNWSGPFQMQDPSFGGGGLGYGGIGGGAWGTGGVPGQQFGTGRMYAGGNPNFNEMAGPWMTTALGGTGRINPLQPSGDQYVGSTGSYSPMSQAPFELR